MSISSSTRTFTLIMKKIFIYMSSKNYEESGYDLDLGLLVYDLVQK